MESKQKTGLKAFIRKKPTVLILGTFPGEETLQNAKEYYCSSKNSFWHIIFSLYKKNDYKDDEKYFEYDQTKKNQALDSLHIALWDIYQNVTRVKNNKDSSIKTETSEDSDIKNYIYNDVFHFLMKHQSIKYVVYNGTSKRYDKFEANLREQFKKEQKQVNVQFKKLISTSNSCSKKNRKGKIEEWENWWNKKDQT